MRENAPMATIEQRPVRLVVRDDLARSRLTVVLPPLPRDPALRLAGASRNRRVRRRLRQLARRAHPGRGAGQPARLRRLVRPLRDAGQRLRLPRGEPVPVVSLPVRLSRRPRDRPAGSPGPLGRLLPARARAAGTPRRDGARRRPDDAARRARAPGPRRVATKRRSGGTSPPSAASRRQRPFLAWFFDRRARTGAARSARPHGLCARLRRAGGRVPVPAHAALPDVRPGARRAVLGPSRASGSRRGGRRPGAASAHRSLPALPRDPPLRLDLPLVDRRRLRRLRRLDRGARAGAPPGAAAPLPRGVRPLRDAPRRVRLPRRPAVPGLHRARGLVRDRPRDRPAGARSSALDDPLPVLPRVAGVHPRERARRRRLRARAPRLVVRARHGADARGDAEPRRHVPALRRRRRMRTRCSSPSRYPYAAPVLRQTEPEPEELVDFPTPVLGDTF